MKKIMFLMLALSAMMLMPSCSSDDDNDNGNGNNETSGLRVLSSGRPDWTVDLMHNESAPDWKAPDPSQYENWLIVKLHVQSELKSFVADDDMLAVFVGDEMRALSSPARHIDGSSAIADDEVYYFLKVYGNESPDEEITVTLKLWSSKLRQTFTVKGSGKFISESVIGETTDFLPNLAIGSSKYPVTSVAVIDFHPEQYGLEASEDDIFSVFVGDECRGTNAHMAKTTSAGKTPLVVFGKEQGEQARVLYYNAKADKVYDTGITFATSSNTETFRLD